MNSDRNRSRRDFLRASLGFGAAAFAPAGWPAAASPRVLRAREAQQALVGSAYPATKLWGYDGSIPGPLLRYRQGSRLRVEVENELPDPTTVHFHGIRLPNAMDGVPHLTQPPIAARDGRFVYEFDLPDAGTYWYHPHLGSPEQVGRGLAGALIVEDADPPAVDRDLAWVLSDWRLDREARIVGDFGNFMDASHGGRIGNTVTVNGEVRETFDVASGERVRLRLINASNARIYALQFQGHEPLLVAYDGHPVEPHRPESGRVVLGPAMRADLILDMKGDAGKRYPVIDDFYPRTAYRLLDLRYAQSRRGGRAGEALPKLAPNPLPEPSLSGAERHQIVFGGGMMSRGMMGGMREGMVWTVNGRAILRHDAEPILSLAHGRSVVLELVNDTRWFHPIHLHGHVFRVLSRNGRPTRYREWRDTVLLGPDARAEIGFVADNPGGWMFHCHVLEHQVTGMMAVVRVA
jgi:FtsP/CotA-like multicopper oxidase with cupredoxin domain